MRQSGILKGHEMAQLTDVPSSVVLRGGGRVHIYRSAEIFGLVLFPAQIANSAVVQSLAEVLHGSYNGVAQFILYICDIYAGAIIIETDGSFYLFDPTARRMRPRAPPPMSESAPMRTTSCSTWGHQGPSTLACISIFYPRPLRQRTPHLYAGTLWRV